MDKNTKTFCLKLATGYIFDPEEDSCPDFEPDILTQMKDGLSLVRLQI